MLDRLREGEITGRAVLVPVGLPTSSGAPGESPLDAAGGRGRADRSSGGTSRGCVRARTRPSRIRGAAALVDRRPRGLLVVALGLLRGPGARRRTSACSARATMPGAEWFPGARLELRRARRPRRATRLASRSSRCSQSREPGRADVGRAARAGRARARRPAAPRRRPRRPGRRLPAEHPRDGRRLPRRPRASAPIWAACAPEFGTRSVIDRFAQIEPTVLLAVDGYRYGDTRRPPAEVAAIRARLPTLSRSCTCPTSAAAPRPGR